LRSGAVVVSGHNFQAQEVGFTRGFSIPLADLFAREEMGHPLPNDRTVVDGPLCEGYGRQPWILPFVLFQPLGRLSQQVLQDLPLLRRQIQNDIELADLTRYHTELLNIEAQNENAPLSYI